MTLPENYNINTNKNVNITDKSQNVLEKNNLSNDYSNNVQLGVIFDMGGVNNKIKNIDVNNTNGINIADMINSSIETSILGGSENFSNFEYENDNTIENIYKNYGISDYDLNINFNNTYEHFNDFNNTVANNLYQKINIQKIAGLSNSLPSKY
jgi:hypothetical protein